MGLIEFNSFVAHGHISEHGRDRARQIAKILFYLGPPIYLVLKL